MDEDRIVTANDRPRPRAAPRSEYGPGCDILVRFGSGYQVKRLHHYDKNGFWVLLDGNVVHEDAIFALRPPSIGA